MKSFFLNYGAPTISPNLSIGQFVQIFAVTAVIGITEACIVYVFLKIRRVEAFSQDLGSKIVLMNFITSLLGMPLIWFSFSQAFLPFLLVSCFFISVFIEYSLLLAVSHIADDKQESSLLDSTIFSSFLLANAATYLLMIVGSFSGSFTKPTERLASDYIPEVYFSFGLFIIGFIYFRYLLVNKGKFDWTDFIAVTFYLSVCVFVLSSILFFSLFGVSPSSSRESIFSKQFSMFPLLSLVVIIGSLFIFQELILFNYQIKTWKIFPLSPLVTKLKGLVSKDQLAIFLKAGSIASIVFILIFSQIFISSLPSITYDAKYPKLEYLALNLEEDAISTLDLREFDIKNRTYFNHRIVAQQIYGFLGIEAPGQANVILPSVAEAWERHQDGSYSFTLREDALFHNNQPVRARDVEYSWKAGLVIKGLLDNLSDPNWVNIWDFEYPSEDPEGNGKKFTVYGLSPDYNPYLFPRQFSGSDPRYLLQPEGSLLTNNGDDNIFCPISCGPYNFHRSYRSSSHKAGTIELEGFYDWFGWGESYVDQNGDLYPFPSKERAFDLLFIDLDLDIPAWSDISSTILYYVSNYHSRIAEIKNFELTEVFTVSYIEFSSGAFTDIYNIAIISKTDVKNVLFSSSGTLNLAYGYEDTPVTVSWRS